MAVREIVMYPDDPLTKVADAWDNFGPETQKIVRDMFETMEAYEGVGLAAPQVGVAKRLFVLRDPEGPEMALFNPEIVEADGREIGEEGCLSLPEVYTEVPRALRIRVKAQDVEGKPFEFSAEGFLARIIQHETDHLNGIIFLDRVDILTRQAKLSEWDQVRDRITAAKTGE